ncbi:GGDEF domain-containing protein [Oricola indica]|uniref:GGDEF domain-containing protein n=1 Tax=Oricola indica TaxID=2872591 RepID=UPI003CCB8437
MDGIAAYSAFLQGLGVVAFAVRLHELALTRCTSQRAEVFATSMTFALGAAVSMTFPLHFTPGITFDLRHVFLVLAAPFGGWPAVLATAGTAGFLRFLQGGIGMEAGFAGIAISAMVSLVIAHFHAKRRGYSFVGLSVIGLASSLSLISLFLLPMPLAIEVFQRVALPFIGVNFVGVLVSAESLNKIRLQLHREKALVRDTSIDPLTGLSNRRVFDARGPELAESGIQDKGRYAIMIIDIDRFKSINDTFGHANGDKVLKDVSRIISDYAREDDLVVRYGGEEIALVLPGCDEQRTAVIADRIREGIESNTIEVSGINLKVTVSIGYVVVEETGKGFWAAFEEADTALYRAKNAGRNRVEQAKGNELAA